jgi:RNA polymerase sigma-70 factor (ECF subfamily)
MKDESRQVCRIPYWVERLQAGDERARDELLNSACQRLAHLAHRMLREFPGVRRWEDTDDVVQNAAVRLWEALKVVRPQSAVHFHRLAALHIRRELIDLARHY